LESQRQQEERAAAEEKASRDAEIAGAERRKEEDRRAVAAREADEEAQRQREIAARKAAETDSLTRSLRVALTRVGCDVGEANGPWGDKDRTALAAFSKHAKMEMATDAPSAATLEAVLTRKQRVCPLECGEGTIERDGKCVPIGKQPITRTEKPTNRERERVGVATPSGYDPYDNNRRVTPGGLVTCGRNG